MVSEGNIFMIFAFAIIIIADIVCCITGYRMWKKPITPEKLTKLYNDRKAALIFTPQEFNHAAQYVTTKTGKYGYVSSLISIIWVVANLLIGLLTGVDIFYDIAIFGNLFFVFFIAIAVTQISKKKYGINILGLDGYTNTEKKTYEEFMSKMT
jgi:hypothetical protein